jgi:hypothetical protein
VFALGGIALFEWINGKALANTYDRLVIDEEQGEDGDVGGDEELPEEVDLRTNGQDRFDKRRFLDHADFPRDAGSPEECRHRHAT